MSPTNAEKKVEIEEKVRLQIRDDKVREIEVVEEEVRVTDDLPPNRPPGPVGRGA